MIREVAKCYKARVHTGRHVHDIVVYVSFTGLRRQPSWKCTHARAYVQCSCSHTHARHMGEINNNFFAISTLYADSRTPPSTTADCAARVNWHERRQMKWGEKKTKKNTRQEKRNQRPSTRSVQSSGIYETASKILKSIQTKRRRRISIIQWIAFNHLNYFNYFFCAMFWFAIFLYFVSFLLLVIIPFYLFSANWISFITGDWNESKYCKCDANCEEEGRTKNYSAEQWNAVRWNQFGFRIFSLDYVSKRKIIRKTSDSRSSGEEIKQE